MKVAYVEDVPRALVDGIAQVERGDGVVPLLALLKVTAFQKVVAYGMYVWATAVSSVVYAVSASELDAVLLGFIGAMALSALVALRRLVMLMIQIGEAAAEKKLRELATTKTVLTEEEVKAIVVDRVVIEEIKSEEA